MNIFFSRNMLFECVHGIINIKLNKNVKEKFRSPTETRPKKKTSHTENQWAPVHS